MAKIFGSVTELAGGTPLVRLHNIEKSEGLGAELYGKLEFFGPTRSSADREVRAALSGILDGAAITAAATGSQAVALGQWAVVKNLTVSVALYGEVSREQRKLIGGYPVKIIRTAPGADRGVAEEAAKSAGGTYVNLSGGYGEAISEIAEAIPGKSVIFVAPVSESDAAKSAEQLFGWTAVLADTPKKDSENWARKLARSEGILAGITSGGALSAATEIAKKPENNGKAIVVWMPDTGERHLSTGAYGDMLTPPEPF